MDEKITLLLDAARACISHGNHDSEGAIRRILDALDLASQVPTPVPVAEPVPEGQLG